jgi:hypothetical protein
MKMTVHSIYDCADHMARFFTTRVDAQLQEFFAWVSVGIFGRRLMLSIHGALSKYCLCSSASSFGSLFFFSSGVIVAAITTTTTAAAAAAALIS